MMGRPGYQELPVTSLHSPHKDRKKVGAEEVGLSVRKAERADRNTEIPQAAQAWRALG